MPELGPVWAVTPQEWGARIDYDSWDDEWTPKERVAVHYGGGENRAGSLNPDDTQQYEDELYVLRSWESYHLSKGWRGLAYNFAVGQSGRVYRARGWNNSGAHYSDDDIDQDGIPENNEAVAVVFILGGNQKPTGAALEAFETLRAWLQQQLQVDRLPLYGHQEIAVSGGHSTACPGVWLMAYIEEDREMDPWDKPVPDWAAASWEKARNEGIIVPESDPDDPVDKKELIVYLDRLGLLDG